MSQFLYEVHAIEERYYRINRVILKSLGLWPYQQSFFTRIQKMLFVIILITCIIAQLLSFVTMQYNRDLVFKIFCFLFPISFGTTKYCCFIIQTDSVKGLLEHMRNDYNLLKTKLEIDIIEKYAYNAKLFTIIVMVFCHGFIFFTVIFQFWPVILNIMLPLNESRPCRLIIVAEYFVNQEKYYFAILLHESLAVYIGMIGLSSVGVTFVIYILHSCALLKIASYRVENVFEMSVLASPRKEYLLHRRIADAVVVHRKAIECIEYFMSNFTLLFIILVAMGITSLSFSLFQCFLLFTVENDVIEIFIIIVFIFAHLSYLYIGNYVGQALTDHGTNFFKATYNGLWYIAPVHTQKLILFLMQKGAKDVTMTLGSILDASLQSFAALTNMAVSYFMMMYQTL
nr:PREDICTED: uncharacterized protein LOC105678144 [Linepithema humile]